MVREIGGWPAFLAPDGRITALRPAAQRCLRKHLPDSPLTRGRSRFATTARIAVLQSQSAADQFALDLTRTNHSAATAFAKLSGCFVATAAYGSILAPDVAAMRQVRDRLRPKSTMFAVATDLYYSTGPAAAEVLKHSDTARALVRRLLGPVGAASQAAVALGKTR